MLSDLNLLIQWEDACLPTVSITVSDGALYLHPETERGRSHVLYWLCISLNPKASAKTMHAVYVATVYPGERDWALASLRLHFPRHAYFDSIPGISQLSQTSAASDLTRGIPHLRRFVVYPLQILGQHAASIVIAPCLPQHVHPIRILPLIPARHLSWFFQHDEDVRTLLDYHLFERGIGMLQRQYPKLSWLGVVMVGLLHDE